MTSYFLESHLPCPFPTAAVAAATATLGARTPPAAVTPANSPATADATPLGGPPHIIDAGGAGVTTSSMEITPTGDNLAVLAASAPAAAGVEPAANHCLLADIV